DVKRLGRYKGTKKSWPHIQPVAIKGCIIARRALMALSRFRNKVAIFQLMPHLPFLAKGFQKVFIGSTKLHEDFILIGIDSCSASRVDDKIAVWQRDASLSWAIVVGFKGSFSASKAMSHEQNVLSNFVGWKFLIKLSLFE